MKIAILSMQQIVNFGSVLQAYSLREILKEVSAASVEFLSIEDEPALESCRSITESIDYDTEVSYPSGIFQKGKRWLIARLSAYNKHKIRQFMIKTLSLSKESSDKAFDYVVVGSDEVFNHTKGVRLQLHGMVRQGRMIFSYAAACGSARAEDIADKDLPIIRAAMKKFQAVSVRDSATSRYVQALYDGPILHHLDPVLVGNLYAQKHRPVKLKNYLLVYAYGQRIRTQQEIHAIRAYAKAHGLKTVAMGGSQFWCDLYIPAEPLRLLDYFYYADCVVTDTFHGAVFSVINHKAFAVIGRATNRNKLTGLLEDLRLEDRLLTSMETLESVLTTPVDYDGVDVILQRERIKTREYLKKQLGVEM